ncbi:MAG: GAF domain-containing protein [Byssovorax sp.]
MKKLLFIEDSRTGNYVLRGTIGGLKENVGKTAYEPGEGFTGWVCKEGQPIMLDDPNQDERWRGKYVEFPTEQIASFIAVPIVSRGKSVGAIRVLRKKSDNRYLDNRFNDDDLRLLQTIAEQMAVGLESLRSVERIIRSERMIAWGELSAKSSHMIGNRVFALKGDVNELGHLLSEAQPDLKEIGAIQASLATNVTRVEEILQDFRDFVTATQVNRELSDLNQILRETAEEIFPRRSRVELDLDLDPELPPISLDSKKIRRAFSELIEVVLPVAVSRRL